MIVHQIVPQIMLWSLDEVILQLSCYEPRGQVEPPTTFSRTRGLKGPPILEEVVGKEGGDFFQGGRLQF